MKNVAFLWGLFCFIVTNCYAQKDNAWHNFPTDESFIYDISFSHNGGVIGVADGKSVKVYSTGTTQLLRNFENGHTRTIHSIDISRDSSLMVSGGKDSTVVLWDFKEGGILQSLKANGIVTTVAISADGRLLAYGGTDRNVCVYDRIEQKSVHTFTDHTKDITSVIFSADGQYMATSGGDKLIYLYKDGVLMSTLAKHKDWVRAVSFSPDNTRLVSCSDDGRVILWDISNISCPEILNISKHGNSWLTSVDFNEDNKTYALAGIGGNVKIKGQYASYRGKIKSPVHKICFKPNEGARIKVAVATRGKGVLLIDALNLKIHH